MRGAPHLFPTPPGDLTLPAWPLCCQASGWGDYGGHVTAGPKVMPQEVAAAGGSGLLAKGGPTLEFLRVSFIHWALFTHLSMGRSGVGV